MKNLKKVLALGLALVMLLGMFTVASAAETEKKLVASDFTDFDTVADSHKDAVSLNVDLGILKGIEGEDGKFSYAPTDSINRASWAKIVYFLCEGNDDAEMYKDENSVIKDVKGHWAEGYICYLAGNNMISGDAEGNYMPDADLTVAAAYKMLLTTLGFHADYEGFQNDENWSGNVMRFAKKYGLTAGVDKTMNASAKLTRENAAQMVYNALGVKMREPIVKNFGGTKFLDSYDVYNETLGYTMFGLVKLTATVTGVTADGATLDNVRAYGQKLGNKDLKVVQNKIAASDKAIGQNVTLFAKGSLGWDDAGAVDSVSLDELISTSLAAGSSDVLASSYEGIDLNKAIDSSEKDDYVADAAASITVYMDGVSSTVRPDAEGKVADWGTDVAKTAAKLGNLVELIDNSGEGTIDTVKITTYTVAKVGGDLETRVKNDKDQIRLKGVIDSWTDASTVTGYAGLKKDDVVLKSSNGVVTTIEKADKITGKVTLASNKNDEITVAGDTYSRSEINNVSTNGYDDFKTWPDRDNEFDFYLDKAGAVCYTVQITEETTTDVAYILRTTYVDGTTNVFDKTEGVGKAEVLFTDGTSEIVDVVEANGKKGTDLKDAIEGLVGFAEVSEGSKGWTITMIDENITTITEKDITAAPKFDETNSADLNTIFLIGKGPDDDNKYEYKAYTGYKTIPGMQAASGYAYSEKAGAAADYVYLTASVFDGDTPEGYVYIKDAGDYNVDNDKNKIFNIVNAEGENDDDTILTVADGVEIAAAGLYEIKSVDEDGIVTGMEAVKVEDEVTSSGSGVFVAGSTTASYDNATVCVVIDLDADEAFVEASNFNPDDLDISTGAEGNFQSVKAVVLGGDNKVATYIYVIRVAVAEA